MSDVSDSHGGGGGHKLFGIDTLLGPTADHTRALDQTGDHDYSTITPYNFFTASAAVLDKVRAGQASTSLSSVSSVLPATGTLQHGNSALDHGTLGHGTLGHGTLGHGTLAQGNDLSQLGLGPGTLPQGNDHHQLGPGTLPQGNNHHQLGLGTSSLRKRKPSATVTSATAPMIVPEPEFLPVPTPSRGPPAPLKTEVNSTFGISTITTKTKTERTIIEETTTSISRARTALDNLIDIDDINPTLKYDFGSLIPNDQVLFPEEPPTIKEQLGLTVHNLKQGADTTPKTEETTTTGIEAGDPGGAGGAGNTTPHDIIGQFPNVNPLVPLAANIGSWFPISAEVAKKKKKSFTPIQVEELNHQMRMYILANQYTINAKKAQAQAYARPRQFSPPKTRSKSKIPIPTNQDPIAQNPFTVPPGKVATPTKAGAKSRNGGLGPLVSPPAKVTTPVTSPRPRGRPKKVMAEGIVDLTVLENPSWNTKTKPSTKRKKPQVPGRSTSVNDPDSPIPLVFVDCLFCAISKPTFETITIESCLHIFCRECLSHLIENNTDPQIPCPVRDEGKCNGVLSDPEIKELVSDDVFQKYLSRSLASALEADSQLTPCFFFGCSGICLIEGDLRLFYCPVCSKLNCLDCKTTHENGPCSKKKKQKHGGIQSETEGAVGDVDVIDVSTPTDEDNSAVEGNDLNSTDEGAIAMKLPIPETEEEIKLRLEWEASWAQLVSKFNAGKETEGPGKSTETAGVAQAANVFSDLITTDHVFECPICFVDAEVGEGVILQECFHRFCRDCLAGSIQHSEEIRVKCPYQSGNYSCQMHISDREVRALASEEVYDKLLKKSLAAAEMGMSNAFHCQSVNCTGWAEIDNAQVLTFRCYICKKKNCIACKAIHDTLTCAEYQSKLKEGEFELASKEALNRMLSKGEAMKCPTCNVVIIKNGGCDGMTCVVCQTHICWATKGPRWGPKGRGDDSAGCRCGFDGKKCHPKCGNCH